MLLLFQCVTYILKMAANVLKYCNMLQYVAIRRNDSQLRTCLMNIRYCNELRGASRFQLFR